jgi:hypothetical protein
MQERHAEAFSVISVDPVWKSTLGKIFTTCREDGKVNLRKGGEDGLGLAVSSRMPG